jgi:hypothetical protein
MSIKHNTDQGEQVRTTEQPAKRPASSSGSFAALSSRFLAGGSGAPSGRAGRLLLTLLIAAAAALSVVPAALGAQTRLQSSTIDGSDTDVGAFQPFQVGKLGVHQQSGTLYAVTSGAPPALDKFDASGAAQDFASTSSSSLTSASLPPPENEDPFQFGPETDVAVDNSGTSSDGDFVLTSEIRAKAWIFGPGGDFIHTIDGFIDPCGAAVDPDGKIWVADLLTQQVSQYTSAGVPTGVSINTSGQGLPCHIAFASNGDLYVQMFFGGAWKYPAGGSDPTLIDGQTTQTLTVDRGSDELYVVHPDHVSAYAADGTHEYDFAEDPSFNLGGIAINEALDRVYVTDMAAGLIRVYGAPILVPDATTGAASAVSPTTATLNGSVSPHGVPITDCHFDYGTDTSYGQTIPCAETVGAETTPVSVHADLSGLDPLQTYHFRLVANSAVHDATGVDANFFTATAPTVDSQSVSDTTQSSANLKAQINPHGAPTSYYFEYGTTAAYGTQVPLSPASAGSGKASVAVSQALTGLDPSTIYHWHVVVTNNQGDVAGPDKTFSTYPDVDTTPQSCPNVAFRTGHAATLPDCRAYEQVTPTNKNGNEPAVGDNTWSQASDNGNAVTFRVYGGIPGGVGAEDFPAYMARRGDDSWSTAGLFPPPSYGQNSRVMGWSRDMATIYEWSFDLQATSFTILARDSSDGSIEQIVPHTTGIDQPTFDAASRDGSKVYFDVIGTLTPDSAPGANNLYVWDRPSGTVKLVGLLPASEGGTAPADGSFAGPYAANAGRLDTGGAKIGAYLAENHAISDDGATAFFTAAETGQLYVRKNPTEPSATTVRISASQKTNGAGPGGSDPAGPKPALFRAATPDGATVLFTSSEELTDNATTGPADQGSDLYSYDVGSDQLTDLTPDPADANGADVQGVIGMSEDASYVYFAANGVLAPGATPGDCRGQADVGPPNNLQGACNLYLAHAGDITFISRLDLGGNGDTDAANWQINATFNLNHVTGRVTPDGHTLLFRSRLQLTSYDNSGCQFGSCPEFYRYRVGDSGVTCLSCDPSGAPPTDQPTLQKNNSGFVGSNRLRNLSADGNRFFFESTQSLLPADTNGVRDVYLWQAENSGSCHSSAANGGCLYLISTGRDPNPSSFLDASSSGDDIYFYTRSQLVGQDRDQLIDVYDARVDGGLASQNQPAPPPPCSGDACQPPASRAPEDPSPGTTRSGPGNQTKNRAHAKKAKKCKKGKKGKRCRKARQANTNRGGSK